MEIKGIIFDYGGTIDTNGDHWSHVIREGWNQAGIIANDALFREAYIYGEQELERSLRILPQHNYSDLLDIKIQIELQYLAQTGNFPPAMIEEKAKLVSAYCYSVAKNNIEKAKPVLEKLAQRYPLVIVSNFYGNLETVLKDFGIRDLFKKVIDSTDVKIRKPSPGIFELGIKAIGLNPGEVLVVGDSEKNDIQPAKKLGCHTLLIKGRGWDEDSPLEQDGDSIEKLEEILRFLGNA